MVRIGQEVDYGGSNRFLVNLIHRVKSDQRRDQEQKQKVGGQQQIRDLLVLAEPFARDLLVEIAVRVQLFVRVEYLVDDDCRTCQHDHAREYGIENQIDPFLFEFVY